MSEKKLKTGFLGVCQKGLELLEAAGRTGLFEIHAIAGSDMEVAEKVSQKYNCDCFDDYRQFVIQNQFDVLFVAAPSHLCSEYIRAAIKKKINIVKLTPPGSDFEQTAELIQLARKENVRFAVCNSSRFSKGCQKLEEYLNADQEQNFHLIRASVNLPVSLEEPGQRWLTDPQLAGGGVLLHNCYELIDRIVRSFGVPQQIYSVTTNHAPDKQQRLSLTEDTAIMTMKFSDTLLANLVASRTFGPAEEVLRLYSREKYITVTRNSFTVCDSEGKIIEDTQWPQTGRDAVAEMLENFALSMLQPDKKRTLVEETTILNNMAIIGSAYLSNRTAMPEEPAKILQMALIETANILTSTIRRLV